MPRRGRGAPAGCCGSGRTRSRRRRGRRCPAAVSVTRRWTLQPSSGSRLGDAPDAAAPPRGTVVAAGTVVGTAAPRSVVVVAGAATSVVDGRRRARCARRRSTTGSDDARHGERAGRRSGSGRLGTLAQEGRGSVLGCQAASRALIAQASPSAGASTASCSCQPVAGSWASHQHQRSSPAMAPSSSSGSGQSSSGVAERGEQPERAEPAGGGAAPAAVGAAARACPRQPGDALPRRRGRPAGPSPRRGRGAPPRRRPRRRRPRHDRSSSSSTARRAGAPPARRSGRRARPRRRRRGRRRPAPRASAAPGTRRRRRGTRPAGTRAPSGDAVGQVEHVGERGDASRRRWPRRAAPARGRRWPPAAGLEQRGQLGPRVVLGDDLGQRPDREPPRSLVEHAGGPLGRGQQRQPVLGERRRRPQLAAGADGVAGTVAQPPQPRPVAGSRSSRRPARTRPSRSARWMSPSSWSSGSITRATSHQRPRVAAAAVVAGEHAVLGEPARRAAAAPRPRSA